MKVIICCQNLTGGGAERVASLWAKGFHDKGHKVILFLTENKISYDIPNCPIVIIGNKGNTLELYVHWYSTFRKEFKRLKPDVFISINHPWAIIAKAASKGREMKIVSTEHNAFEKPDYVKMGFMDRLHKFYLNRVVDNVTVLTEADKKCIGNRLNNVTVLPNPLAFESVCELPKKEKIILAIGRLDAWYVKGFDLLIKAWGQICRKYPEWKLRIVGSGAEEIREYLRNIGAYIDECQFEILDFDKEIIKQYQKAAVFVLSSRYEGFGMVLIEAMSQGCACIACDYKGRQSEIVSNGVNGLVVEVNNETSISASLEYLLSNTMLISQYAVMAIKRANDFSLDRIMKLWDSILVWE